MLGGGTWGGLEPPSIVPRPSLEQVRDPIPTAVLRSQARGPPRPLPVCPSAALTLPGPGTRPRPRRMGGCGPTWNPRPLHPSGTWRPLPFCTLPGVSSSSAGTRHCPSPWSACAARAGPAGGRHAAPRLPHALDTSGRTSTSVTVQRSNIQSGSRHHSPPFTETEISPLLIKLVLRCINRSRRGRTHGAFVYH